MVNGGQTPLRVALIAGEASGDKLGGELMRDLSAASRREVIFSGLGGPAMRRNGLSPLFEMEEISVMGLSAVLFQLPRFLKLIEKMAQAVIDERPHILVIIDSPDFTHRVAKRVRTVLRDILVVNYVCPSVWAWRANRAKHMRDYIDHVLALLPFEPTVLKSLGGPRATFVGHPLSNSVRLPRMIETWEAERELLVLPGSRKGEVQRLLPHFKDTIAHLAERRGDVNVTIPTFPSLETLIRDFSWDWALPVKVITGDEHKKAAFDRADAALAASGTVCLELGMAGVPMVAAYVLDPLARRIRSMVKIWSANLPNLILDYPLIPEFYDEFVCPAAMARHIDRLLDNSPQRTAQLEAFKELQQKMTLPGDKKPSDEAAHQILKLIKNQFDQ